MNAQQKLQRQLAFRNPNLNREVNKANSRKEILKIIRENNNLLEKNIKALNKLAYNNTIAGHIATAEKAAEKAAKKTAKRPCRGRGLTGKGRCR